MVENADNTQANGDPSVEDPTVNINLNFGNGYILRNFGVKSSQEKHYRRAAKAFGDIYEQMLKNYPRTADHEDRNMQFYLRLVALSYGAMYSRKLDELEDLRKEMNKLVKTIDDVLDNGSIDKHDD